MGIMKKKEAYVTKGNRLIEEKRLPEATGVVVDGLNFYQNKIIKQTTRLSDCIVAGQSVFVYSLLPFLLSGCLVSCVCGFTVYGLNLSIARNSFACMNDFIERSMP